MCLTAPDAVSHTMMVLPTPLLTRNAGRNELAAEALGALGAMGAVGAVGLSGAVGADGGEALAATSCMHSVHGMVHQSVGLIEHHARIKEESAPTLTGRWPTLCLFVSLSPSSLL